MAEPGATAWLPEPYAFVRAVTVTLAVFWTLRGAARGLLMLRHIGDHFDDLGLERGVLHRAAARVALRATVLDPLNLALIAAIVGLWIFAGVVA